MGKDEQAYAPGEKVKKCRTSSLILSFLFMFAGCSSIPRVLFPTHDPLTAEEHNNLGVAYEKKGKYELALREYKKALDMDDELMVPLVNMGNVFSKQKEYEKAKESYLKALKRDEKNIEAANNLASLYIELAGDYEKGLQYLTRATYSLDPIPAYALDTLGVLYLRLGEKSKAKEMLEKACLGADDEALLQEIETHLVELGAEGCMNKPHEETSSNPK